MSLSPLYLVRFRLLFLLPVLVLAMPASLARAAETAGPEVSLNQRLAVQAVGSLASGIRYQFGGTDPERGLDCSAFVAYLFREAIGGSLPRTAREISDMGEQVSMKDMEPGDLVFFGKGKRKVSHVGIYVGGKKFIHASRKHGAIYESGLNEPYWQSRFNGARRLSSVRPRS